MNSPTAFGILLLAFTSSACGLLEGDAPAEDAKPNAAPSASAKAAHPAASGEAHKAAKSEAGEKTATGASAEKSGAGHGDEGHGEPRVPRSFGMPFAWEVSRDEPLARTRAFLSEVLGDNANNVSLGKDHFQPFVDTQKPRATVVTCADSRVQAQAWDATPENDDFTVRNIGNQVVNAHGSVEYGVEHLKTPVLMIIGHTGCGAVKAAIEQPAGLDAPIREELKHMKFDKRKAGETEKQAFTNAVIANVNNQVSFSTDHFGKLIQQGQLTVVGAVYDFRNDMGKGFGRLNIVNVNGNSNPERLKAFSQALEQGGGVNLDPVPQRPLPLPPETTAPAREAPSAPKAAAPKSAAPAREMHAHNDADDHGH
jgi:carbonic anhydrase